MAFSLKNGSIIQDRKVLEQHSITNPTELSKEPTNSLTIRSVAKAALVAFGTIASFYLVKTINIFSYIGLGSKNPKDVNGNEIVEVKNEEQSLAVRRSLEKVEESRSLFRTRSLQSLDENKIVEFEEMEIQEFKIQEFDDLPEVTRRAGGRRSISIQNPIPDQNINIGNFFNLTINGATIFNSNTIFVEAINIPTWMTSSSVNSTFKGSYDTPDIAYDVALFGNYAYVADGDSGLQIIDISDPANPTFEGSYDTHDFAMGIVLMGNYAYVAGQTSSLQIIGISDPANPTFKSSYNTPGNARGIVLMGNYAYITASLSGLEIIDISNPGNPTFIGSYDTPGFAGGIALLENYAYVVDHFADQTSGLQIIDISDPANPTFKGSYDTLIYTQGIALLGNYAYVVDGPSGLQIIDISDPANSTFKGSYDTSDGAMGVALFGNYAYVADGNSGLQIIDISDPANPTFKGSYDTSDTVTDAAIGVALFGNYAYVAVTDSMEGSSSLQIISTNLDKLTLSGTPNSAGTYNVNIKGCNEINECITDSFNIIVTDPNINPTLFTALIIISSIGAAFVFTIGLCSVSIGGAIAFRRYLRKNVEYQQIKEMTIEKQSVVKDDLQLIIQQKNPEVIVDYSLNYQGD